MTKIVWKNAKKWQNWRYIFDRNSRAHGARELGDPAFERQLLGAFETERVYDNSACGGVQNRKCAKSEKFGGLTLADRNWYNSET